MENKKSKGFFNLLFAPKSNSSCCNVEFEEIPEEKTPTTEQKKLDLKNQNKSRKEIIKK